MEQFFDFFDNLCRLKAVDSVLSGVESMKQVVADLEIALVSQDTMTSDPSSLHQLREELKVREELLTDQKIISRSLIF